MEAGYRVHLANPAKNVQYSGLKHSDDKYDAFWNDNKYLAWAFVEAAHLGYPGSWTEKFIFYLPIPLMSDPLHIYYSRIR